MNLKEKIEKYKPYNEQEEKDKEMMLKYFNTFDDVLTRNNEFGHFTASAWAVNKEKTKVLMIYHNIYKSWAWTGGHADGESDLLGTAIRELKEETGVENVKVLSDDIFSLEIMCVNGHVKRGKYVSSHVHLNLTYLLEVDENEVLKMKEDENSGVKWVNIEDVEKVSNEKWIIENIYNKLNEKLKNIKGENIMKEIVIASGNKGKIKEAQEILKDFKIVSIEELGVDIDVEEDQQTFEGNAIKKAETIANALKGKMCIADDSGIEIEYLDGFPGVYTKRWHKGTDRERNLALIEKLKGVTKDKRKIKFVTAIAVSDGENTICEKGIIEGFVTEEVRGENGFGFDEIFELENGKTLAELTQEEKNEISARKIALESIRQKLT